MTNSLSFLSECDEIVHLENGNISDMGKYDDLINKENGPFNKFMKTYLKNKDDNIENISKLFNLLKLFY